jgi:hypothetical protein
VVALHGEILHLGVLLEGVLQEVLLEGVLREVLLLGVLFLGLVVGSLVLHGSSQVCLVCSLVAGLYGRGSLSS